MKKFWLYAALGLSLALNSFGQTGTGTSNYAGAVKYVTSAPAGACAANSIAQFVIGTGLLYSCQGGTWGLIAGGAGGNIVPAIITNGLMAEYRMTTGSGTTLFDTSGNGNNATFPGGANNPTWIANTGGLSFLGSSAQYVPLPAALNTAQTIIVVANLSVMPPALSFPALLASSGSQIALWDSDYDSNSSNTPRIAAWDNATGNSGINWRATPLGTHVISWVLDATADQMYMDNSSALPLVSPSGHTQGHQSAGQWWLGGGNAAGLTGARGTNAYTGSIYYALFYNRELSAGEIQSNYAAIQFALTARAIAIPANYPGPDDIVIGEGDSEIGVYLGTSVLTLNTGTFHSIGVAGSSSTQVLAALTPSDYPLIPQSGRAMALAWDGTNDPGGSIPGATTFANQAAQCRNLQKAGANCFFVTMMSRSGFDTNKNSQNLLLRQGYTTFANGLIDPGGDLHMGCDGCSANTTYFLGDQTHPTPYALANILGPMVSRAVNRFNGNNNWTSATTYTTSAPAATAVTASSESGTTATYTFASNPFLKGQMVTFAGITPAGYNDTCQALTSTATQITCTLSVSGLGVGTVFGTGITPLQKDADVYTILGGSAVTPNFSLGTCSGLTGQNIYIKNANTTSPWTVTPFSSAETIDTATSITMPVATSGNFPVVILQSQLISPSAAGCVWKRMQ